MTRGVHDTKAAAARQGSMSTTEGEASNPDSNLDEVGLALLSFAAGSMDALTFFNLGQVFPSAMTGNTALLGLELGRGNFGGAIGPLVAFLGFVSGGAIASACFELLFSGRSASRGIWRLLIVEACLLAAFAWAWRFGGRLTAGDELYGLIILASSAMGIQSVAARLIDRFGISTVVFTSALTSIVAMTVATIAKQPHVLPFATTRQAGMFLTYGVGAGIGGALTPVPVLASVIPCVVVLGAVVVYWRAERQEAT